MEFTGAAVKTHQEAVKAPERFENQQSRTIDIVQDFTSQLSRAVDVSIIDILNNMVGPSWEMSRISVDVYSDERTTEPYELYYICYDGRRIGKISSSITSNGMKIIGNVSIEFLEEAKDSGTGRA